MRFTKIVHRSVSRSVKRSSLDRKVLSSNLEPVKLDTVLPTARLRCDIFSKVSVLSWRNDAEMGSANSLRALAYYSKYNEKFDFDLTIIIVSFPKE